MATKLNIFNALPNVPSDDEDTAPQKGGAQGVKKDRVRNRGLLLISKAFLLMLPIV